MIRINQGPISEKPKWLWVKIEITSQTQNGFKLELTQPVCPLAPQVRLWKWSTTFEATAQSTSVFEVESCVGVHFSLGRDSH